MSDPVQNVEIEDVLSSIRRLVSEDSRPKFDRQAIENIEKDEEEPLDEGAFVPEKLVLTQALRVVDDVPQGAENTESFHSDNDETTTEDLAPVDDPVVADLETNPQGFDPSGDSVDIDETVDTDGFSEEIHDVDTVENDVPALPVEDFTESFTETSTDDLSEGDDENDNYTSPLETRIAEVENAVADQDEQWEPDGEDEGDNAAQPIESLQWEDHYDEVSSPEAFFASPQESENAAGEMADHDVGEAIDFESETQDATLAEDEWTQDDDLDASTLDSEADVDLFGANDAVLDEESLREMVSDIVRQELQGPLGERITRNVRKLVRREIHRALASQELD